MVARSARRPNTGHRACGRSTGHESGSSEPAARPPRGASTPIAFFETIMVKSYETLVDSDTKVDVNTGMVAAGRLQSLIDSRDYSRDLLVMKVQMGHDLRRGQVHSAAGDVGGDHREAGEAEQHPEALDVGTDSFDDDDDASTRPSSSTRTTSFDLRSARRHRGSGEPPVFTVRSRRVRSGVDARRRHRPSENEMPCWRLKVELRAARTRLPKGFAAQSSWVGPCSDPLERTHWAHELPGMWCGGAAVPPP